MSRKRERWKKTGRNGGNGEFNQPIDLGHQWFWELVKAVRSFVRALVFSSDDRALHA